MAALEDYTLSDIRSEVALEFGMDATADKTIIDYKINQALQWLVRQRERWPWLESSHVIDVVPSVQAATLGSFVLGAQTFGLDSDFGSVFGTTVPLRMHLERGSVAGDLNDIGYIVASTGADSKHLVLDAQWRYGTTAGSKYSFTTGRLSYALPSDTSRVMSVNSTDDTTRPLTAVPPYLFEEFRRRTKWLPFGSPMAYTVHQDPINTDRSVLYMSFYPVPADRQSFYVKYYREVQNLTADADVPVLPVKHRPVLTLAAFWFVAQKRKMEPQQVAFYAQQAAQALDAMKQEYDYSAEMEMENFRKGDIFNPEIHLPIVEE